MRTTPWPSSVMPMAHLSFLCHRNGAIKPMTVRTPAPPMEVLDDPEASGEALRHVLVGGVHPLEDFAAEVGEAESMFRSTGRSICRSITSCMYAAERPTNRSTMSDS